MVEGWLVSLSERMKACFSIGAYLSMLRFYKIDDIDSKRWNTYRMQKVKSGVGSLSDPVSIYKALH